MFFDHKLIGIFPKSVDLSDTTEFRLNDTIRTEFDQKGSLIEYCFRTYNGDCDFFVYKRYKIFMIAHYKASDILAKKKAQVFFIDPMTLQKTWRKERVLKPRRSGTWVYYNSKGKVIKTNVYH